MTFTFSKATQVATPYLTASDIIRAAGALRGGPIAYYLPRWWRFMSHMQRLP